MIGAQTTAGSRRKKQGRESTLLYLYGVVPLPVETPERYLKIEGLEQDRPLYLIPFDGLAALVSKVPRRIYAEQALKERFQDHDWVQARALAHHRVLSSLPAGPLLPFKFCTLFTGETALLRALADHRTDLQAAFTAIDGGREWGVKLFVDYGVFCSYLKATLPHLTQLARRTSTVSPGTAFFLKRKLETMAREAAGGAAGERARAIHKVISRSAQAERIQAIRSQESDRPAKELLSNVAYLVPRGGETRFKQVIAELARRHTTAGLSFDVVGPLPPYNFATIDMERTAVGRAPLRDGDRHA